MSIKICEDFGTQICGPTIGIMWANLIKVILDANEKSHDEDRERIAVQNVRVKSMTQIFPDPTIESFCDAEQLKDMLGFMFEYDKMVDIDVVQSFSPGSKSYCYRIKEGKMIDFVIERLSLIPESKKACIVFPTYEDYAAIRANHQDDYLPCLVSIQFRLLPKDNGYIMHTNFYSRSMDPWQKGHGNFIAIAMLSDHVAKEISKRVNKPIELGPLDGMICDAHIYNEKYKEARLRMADWSEDLHIVSNSKVNV